MKFDYSTAFSRNLGWLRPQDQERLKKARVAIAGMGGVGGSHLLTLARLGVGRFHIADFDKFELQNFNRQAGANIQTIGREKSEVLLEMAKAINPEAEIKVFSKGISAENMDEFLAGVNLYVDGLDAFVLDMRAQVFAACAQKKIPGTTVAPVGMGAALVNFMPGRMTFENYFGLAGKPFLEQFARFLVGLSPWAVHRDSLVDHSAFAPAEHKAPSTPMGCEISAGIAATEALKILTGRGKVHSAPYSFHFDAFSQRYKRSWLPGGHRNPIYALKVKLLLGMSTHARP